MPRATLILSLLIAIAGTSDAQACDAATRAGATAGPGGTAAPLILGDSTLFFSVPELGSLGIEADAHGCRTVDTGIEIERDRRADGTLPRLLILALGANGSATAVQLDAILREIGPDRVLGLVTPKEPAAAADVMRAEARAHPEQVILMDWAAFSADRPELFGDDGLHVGAPGAKVYAEFIRRAAAPMMAPSAATLHLPLTADGATTCGEVARGRVFVVRGASRITCDRARQLARQDPLRPIAGWNPYAWALARRRAWTAVYQREDGRVLVTTRERRVPV